MGSSGSPDPRTPVLIGAGQFSNRVDEGAAALEPADMMAEALRRAEADCDAGSILAGADSVRVTALLSWRYRDPGRLVAERIGASPRDTAVTVMGGNYVQTVVNRTALDIVNGEADLVLLCGGEAWRTRTKTKNETGSTGGLGWTKQGDDVPPAREIGEDKPLSNEAEVARGIFLPIHIYPMYDVALRAALGLSVDEHRDRIARLWSRFSEIAAKNPNAWIQRAYTPDELRNPTPENRMVSFPYTKLLNSNNAVEQSAGLIMCSVERAEELGVPRERWVFPHAGGDGTDHWYVSNRWSLHESPAMRLAGRGALELAGVGPDDLAHVDLYSCFPSAVQIAAQELGLGMDRDLTVTGGMSFAGGPWNNYTMHAIATMMDVLRDDPGALGLCSGNGGYTTKHSYGIYSTEPPSAGVFRHTEPQAEIDALPSREAATDYSGDVTIETYTVTHARDGQPEKGLLALLTPDGRRTWGVTEDADTMAAMLTEELVGAPASIKAADGATTLG